MDMQLFRFIVDELSEYPSTSVTLSYEGESLLHPNFVEALSYLNHRGIRPWITTTLMGAKEEVLRACYMAARLSLSLSLPLMKNFWRPEAHWLHTGKPWQA